MISPTKLGIVFLSSIVMAGACLAQSGHEEPKYFHLDFVLKELESGKVINARTYSTTVSTQDSNAGFNIRTGNKVPAWTGVAGAAPTYIDIGVNIDCRPGSVKEVQDQLALYIAADISSAATEPPSSATLPMIRQTRWSSNVIVSLRKPTTIFSSDDPTTKRQMQLELTAIPIK
jgi:hypothetical protein